MFQHWERLAGNPSALTRALDTQVPTSDEVEAVGPDAVELDAAERLVGARRFLSLFEPHADANAAAASRLSRGSVLFMVVIFFDYRSVRGHAILASRVSNTFNFLSENGTSPT
jgi:hypothetical protein